MTMNTLVREHQLPSNPIDILEELVVSNDWPFTRNNDSELAVEVTGRWCSYQLCFFWDESSQSMHFSSFIDTRVPQTQRGRVHELMGAVNERLWIGHFELGADEGAPVFRHTLPLRGTFGASAEQLEDLMDTAAIECERFYPALQLVVWGGRSVADAIATAVMDTLGEA